MKETIHLLHINDVHSHFDHWEKIIKYMDNHQKRYENAGEVVYKLDIGDHMDRVHPYTEGTMGKCNVQLLNDAGMDGATIGNNEGITLPHEALDHLYRDAHFPVALANLYDEQGERPEWAQPYFIKKTPQGRRIGFIGVTAPFYELYNLLGWKITDPFQEIENVLDELKGKVDLIILLSHLGLPSDEAIAAKHPEITVILGGHTHHVLHTGKKINNTLICGAGKYGMYVGHVEISINEGIISTKATLEDMTNTAQTKDELETEEKLFARGKETLATSILNLERRLDTHWFEPSELPAILCTGMKEWCEADGAFINSGLLLDGVGPNEVTRFDLHRICPHPINPCVLTLTGKELKVILKQTQDPEWPHLQIKGLGFRGKVMGMFVYAGIELKETKQGSIWMIAGEPINDQMEYRIAVPDMFTFGYLFPTVREIERKKYFMPEFLRDLLAWKLSKRDYSTGN